MTETLLPTIWFGIIAFEIALYVLLDGADLGIGMLTLFPQKESARALMMKTVGPIWDANETWLVIAGGTLFGAFPAAYAIILNALYIPIMIILFGLILRAVAFEFHEYSENKHFWATIFGWGSLLAVVGQGCAAGGLLSGIAIQGGQFAGGAFDWITPITFFMAVGIIFSYVVVGYAYLIKKTRYELPHESFLHIIEAGGATLVAFLAATFFLPSKQYIFFERWTFEPTRTILFAIAGLIIIAGILLALRTFHHVHPKGLHGLSLSIFVLGFIGLLVGIYPYLAPPSLTIFDAAASSTTLRFMLWGIGPLIPIICAYNWYIYRVFKGDLSSERGESYGGQY